MRGVRIAVAVFATVAWADQLSAAEPPGPYINLGLGASFLEGLSVTGPAGNTTTLNENVGILGTAAYGAAFLNGFRAELEFGYRRNSAKNVTLPGGGTTPTSLNLKADAAALSYMANGYYDFDPRYFGLGSASPWTPYIGVGVGAANVRISNVGHDWPFAWQAMAGIDYAVTPVLRIGAEYKFLGTEGLTFHSTNVQSHANYYDHAVLLMLRWDLAPPPAKPAAYTPPPAPPPPTAATPAPAPALAPQSYDVYFPFNQATLTPEARSVVQRAAAAAQHGGRATRLNVTGHTDTSGSSRYNEALSQRRAEAVRAELVRDGVPADEIVTAGRGESELAVPTANGVREPRNRRVIILVQGTGA